MRIQTVVAAALVAASLLPVANAFVPSLFPRASTSINRGRVQGIPLPAVSNGFGRSLVKLRTSGSEPGWEEYDDDKEAAPPQEKTTGRSVGVPSSGGASTGSGSARRGMESEAQPSELKPSLQELARRARERAESAADSSFSQTSGSAAWKRNLARRMEEASAANAFTLPLPGFSMPSVGLKGNWKECGGSFVLDSPVPPVGIIHFLGGAFVGAAPHISYKLFLELLADEGYVIVATPYRLTFDYLEVCAGIEVRSKQAFQESIDNHGRLPIISLGHSAGSLLHIITSCLFPRYKRDAAVFISYNNFNVKDSIPGFDDVVSPATEFLVKQGDPVKRAVLDLRSRAEDLTTDLATSGIVPRFFGTELLSLAADSFEVVEQVPGLLTDIAEGKQEFFPAGDEIRELIKTTYKMPSTFIVDFEKDGYDESDVLKGLLREGDVSFEEATMQGNHWTPIIPDPLVSTPFDSFDPLLPVRRQIRQKIIEKVWELTNIVTPFLNKNV